ncbi:hypothetical protein BDV98DRAFT_565214 [Pterulicium gracile]|uniref:Uncharacterized protein n=1 Tax=Pterulicium gracile TaxID=1884261 RepID=A0A5C3QM49_9AGAR|nr:hypothetical protein BDV98DRAFT_565214 [Pterula gracilis]
MLTFPRVVLWHLPICSDRTHAQTRCLLHIPYFVLTAPLQCNKVVIARLLFNLSVKSTTGPSRCHRSCMCMRKTPPTHLMPEILLFICTVKEMVKDAVG